MSVLETTTSRNNWGNGEFAKQDLGRKCSACYNFRNRTKVWHRLSITDLNRNQIHQRSGNRPRSRKPDLVGGIGCWEPSWWWGWMTWLEWGGSCSSCKSLCSVLHFKLFQLWPNAKTPADDLVAFHPPPHGHHSDYGLCWGVFLTPPE